METQQTKKTGHSIKVQILIILVFCIAISACKKEDEYPSKDPAGNPTGPTGVNVTGLFNVFIQKNLVDKPEDIGIEEVSYDSKENLLVSRKVLGNSNVRVGDIQWQCIYMSDVNTGTYFIVNTNGFISNITCNFTIVDKNQIICQSVNGLKIYMIRRFVQSK